MTSPYCPDVYHGMYVEKQSESTAKLGFCCLSSFDTTSEVIDVNNPVTTQQREIFETQERASVCKDCWQTESLGGRSRRQAIIDWYEHRGIQQDRTPNLVSLDYNTENICNLACITCGPRFSSRWVVEAEKMGLPFYYPPKSRASKNVLFDTLEVKDLRRVYFNGGEPFLTDDHIRVLKKVQQHGDISALDVNYNTNGTVLPTQEVFDIWKKCRSVKVMFSIDAVGSAFEFIRYPASWQEVNENLIVMRQACPSVMFDVTFTLGIHNILYLPDTINWYERAIKRWSPHNNFNLHFCESFGPGNKHLSLSKLGYDQKQKLKSMLNIDGYSFQTMIMSELDRRTQYDPGFLGYLDALSQTRGLDWKKSLEKLADFLDI